MLTRASRRRKLISFRLGSGADAAVGDVAAGGPEEGVEDEAAEGLKLPVGMEVAFGEGEAAAAVLALEGPGDDGLLAAGGVEREEVHAAGVVGTEADAPVVFGLRFERFDAETDGVARRERGGGRVGDTEL